MGQNFYFVRLYHAGSEIEVRIVAPDFREARRLAEAQYPGYSIQNVRQATTTEGGTVVEVGILDLRKVVTFPLVLIWKMLGFGRRRRGLIGGLVATITRLAVLVVIVTGGFLYLASKQPSTMSDVAVDQGGSAPSAADTTSFVRGQAARRDWDSWMASLSSDAKQGAIYWAGERSKRNPEGCDGSADFASACFEARRRLLRIDAERRSDPDFRRGWNATE